MKIKLKLPPDLLFLLHQLVLNDMRFSVKRKSDASLRQELFDELYRRCKSYTNNPNDKPRTLSLWYHLAERLFMLIVQYVNSPNLGMFEKNQLEMIKNELHQKLL